MSSITVFPPAMDSRNATDTAALQHLGNSKWLMNANPNAAKQATSMEARDAEIHALSSRSGYKITGAPATGHITYRGIALYRATQTFYVLRRLRRGAFVQGI